MSRVYCGRCRSEMSLNPDGTCANCRAQLIPEPKMQPRKKRTKQPAHPVYDEREQRKAERQAIKEAATAGTTTGEPRE